MDTNQHQGLVNSRVQIQESTIRMETVQKTAGLVQLLKQQQLELTQWRCLGDFKTTAENIRFMEFVLATMMGSDNTKAYLAKLRQEFDAKMASEKDDAWFREALGEPEEWQNFLKSEE